MGQIDPEEQHCFARPTADSRDEIDLPASDPAQMHCRSISFLALAQSLFHLHSVRGLDDGDKHSADAGSGSIIRNRAVADGETRVLPLRAMPLNSQEQVFLKESTSFATQKALMQPKQFGLNFRPNVAKRQPERAGMLVAEDRSVAVVVDHDEIRTPPDSHGKAGGEQQINDK